MNTSIYIPRISTKWNEEKIRRVMNDLLIGWVSRVDFIPINKKPGFEENVDSVIMSAFVHFSTEYMGANKGFWSTIENDKLYQIRLPQDEYWICLKNKNPVQRTMMNIHQVVENSRHLENLITVQAEEIKNLKEAIGQLQDAARIEKLENTISQEEIVRKNMIDEYISLAKSQENIEEKMCESDLFSGYDMREELRGQSKDLYMEKMILNNRFTERFGYSIMSTRLKI
jgi:hypothetical protein